MVPNKREKSGLWSKIREKNQHGSVLFNVSRKSNKRQLAQVDDEHSFGRPLKSLPQPASGLSNFPDQGQTVQAARKEVHIKLKLVKCGG